ncbi:uncharacterized protein LOC121429043 [Lytechinus variegatus]|uniref:uncharacterized protein LOC121429043 n=1 Tax=Lytechinus variegatus TaxID=7654 RepID=UPI001BB29F99|nr:uncharacterized protein LOC121429043 [Lytechinus variegatus]
MNLARRTGINILSTAIVITLDAQSPDDFKIFYGIGKSGFAFGMVAVPLIAQYLKKVYGWRASLLLLGGFMSHLVPFTMLVDTSLERKEEKQSIVNKDDATINMNCQSLRSDESGNESGFTDNDPTGTIREEPKRESLLDLSQVEMIKNSESGHDEQIALQRRRPAKLIEQQSPPKSGAQEIQMGTRCHAIFEKIVHVIIESIFYQDPWLIALIVVVGFFGVIDGAWHAFLLPRAMGRGITASKALSLAYSAGAGCFIGRCVSGVLPSTQYFGQLEWFLSLTLLNCSSLVVDIFILNFNIMIVTSFVTAMCIAELNILQVTLCQERCPSHAFPVALAVGEVIFGISDLLGTSIAGYLADRFADFNASFIFLLVVEICIFVLMVILKLTKHRT